MDEALARIFELVPLYDARAGSSSIHNIYRLTWENRLALEEGTPGKFRREFAPKRPGRRPGLLLDAQNFPAEGEQSAARWLVQAYRH